MWNANRQHPAGARYRPDIDGLRAIAVLPVVFYHYHVWPFTGGYVGVDIFFVISGYLITALIHTEMAEGRFSIIGFYGRRVRRIFPALFAVLLVASLAALVLIFPRELVRYAKSLVTTAGFISNFQFWSEAGYFDAAAASKPLLHTWSLAVEEQFYLLFPWMLYALRHKTVRIQAWALGAVLMASLALAVFGVYRWPVATFYLLPARFWELLLGGLLALGVVATPRSLLARNALSLAGLAAIGWSIFTLNVDSPFPGANALAPCLGTAAVILAGRDGRIAVNALLATRPLVFVGLISYSLYLWHWPLYVFANTLAPAGLGAGETAALIAASLVLATLSWRYVEQPFRTRALAPTRPALFKAAGVATATVAVVGTVMWAGQGLRLRYPASVRALLAAAQAHEPRQKQCFERTGKEVEGGRICHIGAQGTPHFLLWGDSHADALMPGISDAARRAGKAGLFAAHSRCAPLLDVTFPDTRACLGFNRATMQVALSKKIETVILAARWPRAAGGDALGMEDRGRAFLLDAQHSDESQAETEAVFAAGLERTVKTLAAAHKRIVIVTSVPEFSERIPQAAALMKLTGHRRAIVLTRAQFAARNAYVDRIFARLAKTYSVTFVHPDKVLCAGGICSAMKGWQPLYRDQHHLTVAGSKLLTPLFAPIFAAKP